MSKKYVYGLVLITIFTILLFFISNNKENKKRDIVRIVKKNFNKEIHLPDSIYYLNYIDHQSIDFINPVEILNNKYKVFVNISGGCVPCIQEILQWHNIYLELTEGNNLEVYFVVRSIKPDFFIKNFASDVPVKYKILLDPKDLFIKENNLPYYKDLNTILVDKENKIKLIGNPATNEKMESLFIKTIKH